MRVRIRKVNNNRIQFIPQLRLTQVSNSSNIELGNMLNLFFSTHNISSKTVTSGPNLEYTLEGKTSITLAMEHFNPLVSELGSY